MHRTPIRDNEYYRRTVRVTSLTTLLLLSLVQCLTLGGHLGALQSDAEDIDELLLIREDAFIRLADTDELSGDEGFTEFVSPTDVSDGWRK